LPKFSFSQLIYHAASAVLNAAFQVLTTAEGGDKIFRDLTIDPHPDSFFDTFKLIKKRMQAGEKLRTAKSTKRRKGVKLVATEDGLKKVRVATDNAGAKEKGKAKETEDVDMNESDGLDGLSGKIESSNRSVDPDRRSFTESSLHQESKESTFLSESVLNNKGSAVKISDRWNTTL
jgi:hypothetical protein